MTSTTSDPALLFADDPSAAASIQALVRRMDLWPQLLRRQQEELITHLVPLDPQWLQERRPTTCNGSKSFHERGWGWGAPAGERAGQEGGLKGAS